MLVSSYNNNGLEDVLVVMLKKNHSSDPVITQKEHIVQIKEKEQQEVTGYNFFHASDVLGKIKNGPVVLSNGQVEKLNEKLKQAGFEEQLTADTSPKFVVGHVLSCDPVKDSDHLHVTKTDVGSGEVLQIVCGAINIQSGQKVVVAKPGAVMENGAVIWPGELRGVKSEGMICSAKELGMTQEPEKKGILVLKDTAETGSAFQPNAE